MAPATSSTSARTFPFNPSALRATRSRLRGQPRKKPPILSRRQGVCTRHRASAKHAQCSAGECVRPWTEGANTPAKPWGLAESER